MGLPTGTQMGCGKESGEDQEREWSMGNETRATAQKRQGRPKEDDGRGGESVPKPVPPTGKEVFAGVCVPCGRSPGVKRKRDGWSKGGGTLKKKKKKRRRKYIYPAKRTRVETQILKRKEERVGEGKKKGKHPHLTKRATGEGEGGLF